VYNQDKEERHACKEEDSQEEDSKEDRQEEDSEEDRKEEEVSPRVAGFSLLSSWCTSSARTGDRTTDDLRRKGQLLLRGQAGSSRFQSAIGVKAQVASFFSRSQALRSMPKLTETLR
jgi:hypothetical protein